MYTLLREHANYLGSHAANFASQLVKTPSPSLCENEVARSVQRKMDELGYDKVFVDDFGNVFGIIYGTESSPVILLNSHMDTIVPGKDDPEWQLPLYSGEIVNGKLNGIGSADCKGGLAAQIYAGYLLKRTLLPLRGTLIVAATVSEENGLSLGVQHLLSKTLPEMKMKVDYAVLGEPTDLGLFYGHDGWVEYRLGMDASNSDMLRDAANTVFRNLIEAGMIRRTPGSLELMSVEEPKDNSENGQVYIDFSRRISFGDDADKLAAELKEFSLSNVSRRAGINASINVHEETQNLQNGEKIQVRYLSDAWETDPFSPLMDRAREALTSAGCKARPGKWRLPQLGMGTAGSTLTKRFNIPTIGYGPGKEDVAHAANEYVEVDKITECVLGTASIVHSLVGIPVFGWTSDMEI